MRFYVEPISDYTINRIRMATNAAAGYRRGVNLLLFVFLMAEVLHSASTAASAAGTGTTASFSLFNGRNYYCNEYDSDNCADNKGWKVHSDSP